MNAKIFAISFASSVLLLILERSIGIGWDFHPDSVTYATKSLLKSVEAIENFPVGLINSGFYFICLALGQNIVVITIFNMIIFSLTNVMIFNGVQEKFTFNNQLKMLGLVCLLIFNPYRIHLSTTLLKDTFIMFLFVWSIQSFRTGLIGVVLMPLMRPAGILYYIAKANSKIFVSVLLVIFFAFLVKPNFFLNQIEVFNSNQMQFRDFDVIPTFQNLGIMGSILRGLLWPVLFLTGTFVFLSPAMPYIMVALGIWMTLLFFILLRVWPINLDKVFFVLFAFAVMVTGYSSYLRYVYPMLVVLPLIGNKNEKV